MSCCLSNPAVEQHVIFNTSIQPPIDEEETVPAPVDWNPIVANPVAFLNLKPYIYQPSRLIDLNNQFGVASMNNI